MARWTGTTTQRGLGYAHQADKRRLLKALRPGTPCPRCGQPMWPHQKLDRGHTVDRALGGTDSPGRLEHQHCSRSAGARLGNQLRRARRSGLLLRRQPPTPSRDW
jgi:hypothetical protein